MQVDIQETEGALVIRPTGPRFDALVTTSFRQQALPRVAGAKRVVVDLGKVTFMDSTGLGCLISLLKTLPGGASLALVGVGPEVRSLLELTRLNRVLRTFNSLAEAIGG